MLHIIFLILKIIGIILCLLLLLLLLILFVPIRYSCKLDYFGTGDGWIRIHWLLHSISGSLIIEQNHPRIVIKLFGFPIRLSKKKTEAVMEDFEPEMDFAYEPEDSVVPEISEPDPTLEITPEEQQVDQEEKQEQQEQQQSEPILEELNDAIPESEAKKEFFLKRIIRKIIQIIQSFWRKAFHITDRIRSLGKSIKQNSITAMKKLTSSKQKLEELKEILLEENSRQVYAFSKVRLIRLFQHMGPRKLHLYLHYGFEDPALTGELTGIMAVLMVFYGDKISLEPDFQESVLEGSLNIKGRFQIVVLLWTGVRFLFYKQFRVMIKKLMGKIK